MKVKQSNLAHVSFEVGLILKGFHGILEILGGVLMIFLSPVKLNGLTAFFTKHELLEDPKDIVANYLIALSSHFSIGTQHFAMFYLMSHGLIKCLLILLLWRKKIWAYPLTMVTLSFFILYQLYRYTLSSSTFLILLSVFDIFMIGLTYLEYKHILKMRQNHK